MIVVCMVVVCMVVAIKPPEASLLDDQARYDGAIIDYAMSATDVSAKRQTCAKRDRWPDAWRPEHEGRCGRCNRENPLVVRQRRTFPSVLPDLGHVMRTH